MYGEHKTPEKATNPHQFDYQSYLSQKGISSQFILPSLQETNCTSASTLSIIYSIRNDLLHVTKTTLQDDTTKWLHALVLGDDSLLEQPLIDVFQRWGLSHILAISGLHIGIVVSLLYLVFLKFSLITKEKAHIFILLFLPVYAILAGGQPSVWRASLMVLIVIAISFFKWKMTYTDVLSIVFILLIILDKYIIFHIGFQLSFAVTFGIILSRKWLSKSNSFMESLFQN